MNVILLHRVMQHAKSRAVAASRARECDAYRGKYMLAPQDPESRTQCHVDGLRFAMHRTRTVRHIAAARTLSAGACTSPAPR
jgi:hypothetical protein